MKRLFFIFMVLAAVFFCGGEKVQASEYQDVRKSDWCYEYVTDLKEQGIMTGMTETVFGPSEHLKRAQFAVILYKLAGSPDVSVERSPFSDVSLQTWYGKAVAWAYREGLIRGYSDGTFRPSADITRQEFCIMLYQYSAHSQKNMDYTGNLSAYPDGNSTAAFAKTAVSYCIGKKYLSGKVNGTKLTLEPASVILRAEGAAMLSRYLKDTDDSLSLTAGTYNLCLHNASANCAASTEQALLSRGVDLIALQELTTNWKSCFEAYQKSNPYRLVFTGNATSGTGILYNSSLYTLCSSRSFLLDGGSTYDGYNTKRYVTVCDFTVPDGGHLIYLSAHLEWTDPVANARDAEELLELMNQYHTQNVPVILGADCNNIFPLYYSQSIVGSSFERINYGASTYAYNVVTQCSSYLSEASVELFSTGYNHTLESMQSIFQNGGYSITTSSGEEKYFSVDPSFYGLTAQSSISQIDSVMDYFECTSLDNVFYSPSAAGYFTLTYEKTEIWELFSNASDHLPVIGTFRLRYEKKTVPSLNPDPQVNGLINQ